MTLRTAALLATALALSPARAHAAALDLGIEYRGRAISFSNLELDPASKGNDAYLSERARISFIVKRIALETRRGVESNMEVGVVVQALHVAGSSVPVGAALQRNAGHYPNTDFTPFIENAYMRVFNPLGVLGELTVGKQPAVLGSGLLLSDDGAGFTGISFKRATTRWGGQAFYYQPRSSSTSSTDKFQIAGLSVDIPLDGTLSLSGMVESDHTGPVEGGVPLRSATKQFFDVRYSLATDRFAFEGEAVEQRGSATRAAPGTGKIAYRGTAAQMNGLWKQDLGRLGYGMARIGVAEGSGDDPATPNTNEGFFPSFGHRFDGLERDGWGDFFAATPYDAIGPSTTTASGLPAGVSGVRVVRLGITPPVYRGIRLDADYYIFRAAEGLVSRDLGKEFDLKASYGIKDRFIIRASAAFFTAGEALSAKSTSASRFALELFGKF